MRCLKLAVSLELKRKASKNVERANGRNSPLTISWGVPACPAARRIVLGKIPWEVITTGNNDSSGAFQTLTLDHVMQAIFKCRTRS
jgi:hypothetical protein